MNKPETLIKSQSEIKEILINHIKRAIDNGLNPYIAKKKAMDYLSTQKVWDDQDTTMLDILVA